MKKLRELFGDEIFGNEINDEIRNRVVLDLCDNSKQVTSGSLFVALNQNAENRRKHIEEAIACGAKYILQQGGENLNIEIVEISDNDICFIHVKDVRKKWAQIVSKFFVSKFDNVVAVTGTNGKSSVVDILRQIWIGSGINSASIGTLGTIRKDRRTKLPNNMTSPDCLELHKILHSLCEEDGIKNVAMEATSQGIEQHRVDSIKFNVCAFTNFTQDHLDYHKTFENYWNAKARLFSELAPKESIFVINCDDPRAKCIYDIAANRGIKCIGYGYNANTDDVKIIEVEQRESRQLVKVSFLGDEFSFVLPLQGSFQIYNSLCAATVACFTGVNKNSAIDELQKLHPISGRLELVSELVLEIESSHTNSNPLHSHSHAHSHSHIYIDYAHTPDALQNALVSLRAHTRGRIIVVFGCGGNRDQQKRIMMGKIAKKFSDVVIVTDDNPRNENPEQIRKMILEGCPDAIEIGCRKTAIEFAMKMLSNGDTLLVAGKGHETYQQVGNDLFEFSDKEVILNNINNRVEK
jgi:UDP-N-acetylmuramoyl-L-alanyl-D-glutamate--2,6-diaminopimelate ligase